MTTEERLDKFDETLHNIDKRQDSFEKYMKMYIEKTDKQLEEHRTDIKRLDSKFDELSNKIDSIGKSVYNISVAAIAGMGAIAVSVIVFVAVAIYRG